MMRKMHRSRRSWGVGVVGLLALAVGAAGFQASRAQNPVPPPVSPTQINASKVMGNQACLDCHKPIIEAWQQTKHATFFDQMRQNPDAKTYAAAMGVAQADITGKSVCASCHGMRAEATAIKSVTGVGCESCHGASGGQDGWLNPHGSYGAKDITRETETPEHRAMRFELVDKAGMMRPERDYLIARNCFECHLMYQHGDVVNKAGHPAGNSEFELVSWLHGEVDHNLFIDPKKNPKAPSLWMWRYKKTPQERDRVLYVAGKLAAMEVALRNVANATKETPFSQAMMGHARSYRDDLSDINDAAMLPEIHKVLEEFRKIKRNIRPGHKDELNAYAELVSQTGLDFVKKHDGSKLSGVDSLLPTDVRGKRYNPEK
jgi:hypothetical protein